MGMLAAVEMWTKRDHQAEWRQWEAWLGDIAAKVRKIDGVTAEIKQPSADLSNRTPRLVIQWDGSKRGITGTEVHTLLGETEPRIILASGSGSRPNEMASSVSVVPYMLVPGEEKIIGDRLHAVLSNPPKFENPVQPTGAPAAVSGPWTAHLEFGRGSAVNGFHLEQDGDKLKGEYSTEFFGAFPLTGSIAANTVHFRTSYPIEGQHLNWMFTGTVNGDRISGTVNMGEYGETTWTAEKRRPA